MKFTHSSKASSTRNGKSLVTITTLASSGDTGGGRVNECIRFAQASGVPGTAGAKIGTRKASYNANEMNHPAGGKLDLRIAQEGYWRLKTELAEAAVARVTRTKETRIVG